MLTYDSRVQKRINRLPKRIREKPITIEAVIRGLKAEDLFVSCALNAGWNVSESSNEQDRIEHWDFFMESKKYNKNYRVEVKGIKKISKWDAHPQDAFVWIEIHGKQSYNNGWINGKADLIAFEMKDVFILVKRIDLFKFVQKKLSLNIVKHSWDALYKRYQPKGDTVLTLIKKSDLETFVHLKFQKPTIEYIL